MRPRSTCLWVSDPRTSMSFCAIFCTVVAICQLISSSIDFGDRSFSIILGLFHRPIPVRYNWIVFAREMHSTSGFAKIVLSKCVIHAEFVMVAWTLRGIPFQVGEWIFDLISEFTFFNLVIRLSKVKQPAFFHGLTCRRRSVLKQLPAVSGNHLFIDLPGFVAVSCANNFFRYCSSKFSCRQLQHKDSRHRPRLQVWWFFFFGRRYGSNVHVIRGLTT